MRALALTILTTAFFVAPVICNAQTAIQTDHLAAEARLAQVAAKEAAQLRRANDKDGSTADKSASIGKPKKATAKGRSKSPASRKLKSQLAEAERIRIRDKYREVQKERLAQRLDNVQQITSVN